MFLCYLLWCPNHPRLKIKIPSFFGSCEVRLGTRVIGFQKMILEMFNSRKLHQLWDNQRKSKAARSPGIAKIKTSIQNTALKVVFSSLKTCQLFCFLSM